MQLDKLNDEPQAQRFIWLGKEDLSETGDSARAIIGPPNFMHIWWLEKALSAARSVARVRLNYEMASGFLIAPDIFMTNHHVFHTADDARSARLEFNYRQADAQGSAITPVDVWECDPDAMFKADPTLDYAIVKVKPKNGQTAGEVWGVLNPRHGQTVDVDSRVNLIQHPRGEVQQIALRDNLVKAVRKVFIQYLTDTEYGSSGSPVLDDNFNVVALHSQRVPHPDFPDRWYRNQGFRIEAILADAGSLIP
ncbi:MAG: trypsin-like peptidase domain-containing protein [Anaerolineae bacterium]|nr:trypsin-like peptidase domain-containing protein [Anaerolineae bacterium]